MEIEASGAPAHTRTLTVRLVQREAGREAGWRAEGRVLDLRKRGLVPMAADLQTAGLIHDMRVEAEIAGDPPRLVAIGSDQPSVAFEPSPATAGECCRDPGARIGALAGTRLDGGAGRRLGAVLGGPLGCSHVLTLAQLVLSTVRHALALDAARHAGAARPAAQPVFHRSLSIDGVHGADAFHLAAQLADVHFTPTRVDADTDPFARLAERVEVRVHAEVDLDGMRLRALRAAQRSAGRDDFPGAWRGRSDAVADLAGRSALGGLAGRLFERFGGAPDDGPLLDVLLNLAPTLIQCIPAVMERWRGAPDGARPSLMAGGGMADSCYMWRRDGALHQRIAREMASIRAAEGRTGETGP